jgi:3-oxoacyl-[acyl-carrier protein] reductase
MGGIGQATARALAVEGCSIAVHYASDSSKTIAESLAKELIAGHGVRAASFQAEG